MSYPIKSLVGIDGDIASLLRAAHIRSTARLLDAAGPLRGRKILAEKTGIDPKQLLCWANMADRMRIKGISREYAELLQVAGVDTVRELRCRNAGKLAAAMAAANKRHKLVRLLPSEKVVARWIEAAKKLPLKVTY